MIKMGLLRVGVELVLAMLLMSPCTFAQTVIDTMPDWDGVQSVFAFGVVNTATFGQTITVPPGTGPLSSFEFQIGFCSPRQVDFRAHVFAWNPGTSMATGASLFDSGVMSVPAGSGFTLVTINTGSLTLAPGRYVLFASTSGVPQADVHCSWGVVSTTAYAGGDFVLVNSDTNPAAWTSVAWNTHVSPSFPSGEDLAFRARFAAPVPTLPTWAALVLAALLMTFPAWTLRRDSRIKGAR